MASNGWDRILLLLSFLFVFFKVSQSRVSFNVVKLGADPKGIHDSTTAFENAWSKACSSSQAAGIYVPKGRFFIKLTKLEGPCRNKAISIQIDGSLIAPDDYNLLGRETSWIQIHQVDGLSIFGGDIHGKGKSLWNCKTAKRSCPTGTTNIGIFHSKNINITSFTSRSSQMFHMQIYFSQNIRLERVQITAPKTSPNTDGIHIQGSSYVSIIRSNIRTGDDCISIGPGSNNLLMEQVTCGPGHGISIGGLGMDVKEDGVHTVTVRKSTFKGSQNGLRIKTLGTTCSSVVKDVIFEHSTMVNVENPIIIDQNYCAGGSGCTGKPSYIQISNITYNNIHGSSATEVATKFDCSPKKPCMGLIMEDINLTYNRRSAKAFCKNAYGRVSGTINPPNCLK